MTEIEQAEKVVNERLKSLQKLRKRLVRARKQLESGKPTTLALSTLAEDLRALPPEPAMPNLDGLADRLTEEARKQTEHEERLFQQEIRTQAELAGLNVGRIGDAITIGPFLVQLDWKQGLASLFFSKTEVEKGLPLMPKDLVTHISGLSKTLLAPPSSRSLPDLSKEVEQAIRVGAARRGSLNLAGALRGELPMVFRELGFIKHGEGGAGSKRSAGYSLARFIVEIKTLVQSEFNITRPMRFELVTAVI